MVSTETRQSLIALIIKQKWSALGIAEFNSGFALLTDAEKQIILDSLKANDDAAKILIRQHLMNPIQLQAAIEADSYILNNSIPIDVIGSILQ